MNRSFNVFQLRNQRLHPTILSMNNCMFYFTARGKYGLIKISILNEKICDGVKQIEKFTAFT